MTERAVCPECAAGKHQNCTVRTIDPETDAFVGCTCECPSQPGGRVRLSTQGTKGIEER